MRTHQTHFEVPSGSQTGWWDDQKYATKPTVGDPFFTHALSRLKLSGHNLNTKWLRQQ